MKLFTKSIPRLECNVFTCFRISNKYYSSDRDLLRRIDQGINI